MLHTQGLGRRLTFGSFLGLAILLSASLPAQAPPTGIDKINHVIWIIQENRTFDNYFGTYPGADGNPAETCLPKLPGSADCVKPFHMPPGQPALDLLHDWDTVHAAYNHGAMDGFVGPRAPRTPWAITTSATFPTTGTTPAISLCVIASSRLKWATAFPITLIRSRPSQEA